jgi:hypothetical protein
MLVELHGFGHAHQFASGVPKLIRSCDALSVAAMLLDMRAKLRDLS